MSIRNLLEEFPESNSPKPSEEEAVKQDIEAARTSGYEEGYASGWDDAIADERKRRGEINAEFERCIKDMGFTYHEAVTQVRGELATFLSALFDALFPATIPDLLREELRAQAIELADGILNPQIKLLASESTLAELQQMLPDTPMEVSLEAEPSLGPNQAFLTLAAQERLVDFQPLIDALREQLGALTDKVSPEVNDD